MAIYNQIARLPIIGGDLAFKNYSGTDIPAGTGVLFDTTNKGDVNNKPGIVVPSSGGGVVKTCGITITRIPAGGTEKVCMLGGAVGVASGTINPGDIVQVDDTATFMGQIKVASSTNEILGKALTAAVAGDPVLVWCSPVAHN